MDYGSQHLEIGDHIYSTVEEKCEICNSIIPIDNECVVTSYGGYADPTFKISCMKCVNYSNRKAGF